MNSLDLNAMRVNKCGLYFHFWKSCPFKTTDLYSFPQRGHLRKLTTLTSSRSVSLRLDRCVSLSLFLSHSPTACLIMIFPFLCCIVSASPLKHRLLVYALAVFTLKGETSFCVLCYILHLPCSEPHFYSPITFPSFIFTILYHLCECHG